MHRVKEIIHSSDKMVVGSAVLMLEKNCRFEPLRQKLGRLKRDCNDMGIADGRFSQIRRL